MYVYNRIAGLWIAWTGADNTPTLEEASVSSFQPKFNDAVWT